MCGTAIFAATAAIAESFAPVNESYILCDINCGAHIIISVATPSFSLPWSLSAEASFYSLILCVTNTFLNCRTATNSNINEKNKQKNLTRKVEVIQWKLIRNKNLRSVREKFKKRKNEIFRAHNFSPLLSTFSVEKPVFLTEVALEQWKKINKRMLSYIIVCAFE